ncbi:sensor histidine kinase [Enterocloster sp. OA13]|uniref:Sensor histidine kinase n=1 Tax=Enterocloster hominis (ex Hitch et al. 2024) TaxID=1917870 RepID=A0ABV1DEB2_9FIRM|nr:sensor histidine kinase [Lachnoclostridium pacaense]MCC2877851.1 sensor histidine kinase [Lachnoclostridium pacaense]MCH1950866.1 sensor histidine kinase [Enterocloster sp. OA13]
MKSSIWSWRVDKNSMKIRLLFTLFAAVFILTIIVSAIGYKTFERTLVSEIGHNRADVLRQVGERVRQVKENAYTLSNLYYYDSTLYGYLERMDAGEQEELAPEFEAYMERLTSQYQNSFYESGRQFQVTLALEHGGGYCMVHTPEHVDCSYMSPKTKIWYKKMLFAYGDMIDIACFKDKENQTDYFCVARSINDKEGNPLAYLMINMEESQIYGMYQSLTEGNRNTVYVVDEGGTIISSSNRKLNGFEFFHMKNLERLFGGAPYIFTRMQGENILFTHYYDQASGFTVLEEIPLSVLMEPIRQVRLVILTMALLAVGAAGVYACHFVDKTTRPISQLCEFMLQVEGENLDQECSVHGYTEINILSNRLNAMLNRMRGLMEGIRQKEKQKRRMELSFLQAQINPHFMYNTLFSIKCMVDMEKNEEASRMLVSFIQLLRSTLSNPNEFVMIREEFQVLRQYVEIQKFRYDDGFQVIFECDEGVEEKKIPKLLIQPLLENAIFHGVEFKKGEGLIIITARALDGGVAVTVEDNGMGIAPETIEKINRGERMGEKAHVGIVNVKERIQLNFGGNYGMKIESVQWEGTKIILNLPAID